MGQRPGIEGHAEHSANAYAAACLRIAGEIVATHLGALHDDRFYWLMSGYEAGDWNRYSVGRALLHALVEWCIDHQVKTFDLTVGDEEYKRFWANSRLPLFELTRAVSGRGGLMLAARAA